MVALVLIAGIDTTWSAIGSTLWHLATHPDDAARLTREPALMGTAVEEFLRAYAPVTMARVVTSDTEFEGCPMRKGDKVLMNFPAANRDPAAFERADEVVLDRAVNRHLAFGSASTGAPAPTSRGWSSRSPSRSGSAAYRRSASPRAQRSCGPAARCGVLAGSRSASADVARGRGRPPLPPDEPSRASPPQPDPSGVGEQRCLSSVLSQCSGHERSPHQATTSSTEASSGRSDSPLASAREGPSPSGSRPVGRPTAGTSRRGRAARRVRAPPRRPWCPLGRRAVPPVRPQR